MTLLTIRTKTPTDPEYQIQIDDKKTIGELKEIFRKHYSFVKSNANLFFNSKLLSIDRSLFSYGITDNSLIYIIFRVR